MVQLMVPAVGRVREKNIKTNLNIELRFLSEYILSSCKLA
jgi:hypothetical protein